MDFMSTNAHGSTDVYKRAGVAAALVYKRACMDVCVSHTGDVIAVP